MSKAALRSVPRNIETSEPGPGSPPVRAFLDAVRLDHEAIESSRKKYASSGSSRRGRSLGADVVQRIGFQMMIAVRLMRMVRDLRVPFGAQVISRLIRHLYGAEIHWDAELSSGVSLVHGTGLVISHGATVGSGCILFQGVTLGESIDPLTRAVGSPTLERNVHVGPGAVLLGPITIGEGSKISANVVVSVSVPAGSVVRSPEPSITIRGDST